MRKKEIFSLRPLLVMLFALFGMTSEMWADDVLLDQSFISSTSTNTLPTGWTGYQWNGSGDTKFKLGTNGAVVASAWKKNALSYPITISSTNTGGYSIEVVTYAKQADNGCCLYLSSSSYSLVIGNSYTSNSNVYVGEIAEEANAKFISFQSTANQASTTPTVLQTCSTVDVSKSLTYELTLKGTSLTGTVTDGTNTDAISCTIGSSSYSFDNIGMFLDCSAGDVGVKSIKVSKLTQSCTIKYLMKDIDESVWSQSTDVTGGSAYPEITTALPYGVTATAPTGTVTADETVTLDWSFSPFTYADSYSNISQWYSMDIHGNEARYPVYYDGTSAPAVDYTANTSVPQGVYGFGHVPNDTYKWAFVGDPFNGFKIYNKAAGSSASMYQASDADVQITMDASGQAFTVYQGTTSDYIAFKVSDRSYYLNHRSSIIQGWDAADGGSSFRVYEINYDPVTTLESGAVKIGSSSSYINTSATAALASGATACAMHTSTTSEGLTFTYNAAKGAYTITDVYDNNIVYSGSDVSVVSSADATDDNKWWFITDNIGGTSGYDICPFTAQVSESSNAWNLSGNYNSEGANTKLGLWTTNGSETYAVILPLSVDLEAGAYKIINAKTAFDKKIFLDAQAYNSWYATTYTPGWEIKDIGDAYQYWTLEKTDDNYYLKNYKSGQYIVYDGDFTMSDDKTNGVVTFASLGSSQYNIYVNGGDPMHADGHGSYPDYWKGNGLVKWTAGLNSASAWYIEALDFRTELKSLIDDLQKTYLDSVSDVKIKYYTTTSASGLQTLVDAANVVYNNASATDAECYAALVTLHDGKDAEIAKLVRVGINNKGVYLITSTSTSGVSLYYNGSNNYVYAGKTANTSENQNHEWAIYTLGGKTYLYNLGAGMFVHGISGWGSSTSWPMDNETIRPIDITANGDYYNFRDAANSGDYDYLHYNSGYSYGSTNWSSSADNSKWSISASDDILTDAQLKAIATAIVTPLLSHGGELGYLTSDACTALNNAVTSATSDQEIVDVYNALTSSDFVLPEAGKYYYLNNYQYPTYYLGQDPAISSTYSIINTAQTAKQVWFYDGTTLIGADGSMVKIGTEAQSSTTFELGFFDGYAGSFYINGMHCSQSTYYTIDGSSAYNDSSNPYHTIKWADKTSKASHWCMEEVTDNLPTIADGSFIKLSNAKYGNYFLQPVKIGEDKENDGTYNIVYYAYGAKNTGSTRAVWQLLKPESGDGYKLYNPYYNRYLMLSNKTVSLTYDATKATVFTITPDGSAYKIAVSYAVSIDDSKVDTRDNYFSTIGKTAESISTTPECYWNVIPFTIGSASCTALTTEATTALTNAGTGSTDFFKMTKAAVTKTTTAKTTFASAQTELNYIALDKCLHDFTSYNMPTTGRFFIHNCNTSSVVGGSEATQKYLTNYGSITCTPSASYYSIWDLTTHDQGETYTLMNEGAAYIMTPRVARDEDNLCVVQDKAYIGYTKTGRNYDCYQMVAAAEAQKFVFTPNGLGQATLKANDDDYLASIAIYPDYNWTSAPDLTDLNHMDETLQSGITGKDNQLWTVSQFTASDEADLFNNNIRTGMVGYIGGPITMTDIENVASLNKLDELMTDDHDAIAEQGDDATKLVATGETNAKMFQKLVNYMSNMDESKAEGDAPEGMDPSYRLELAEGKTFYLENLSRPSASARLEANPSPSDYSQGGAYWITVPTTSDNYATNYTQFTLEAVGENFRIKNVNTGGYIASRNAGAKNMGSTTDKSDAAQIQLKEVVPGVYLIYDASWTTSDQKYMTIGGSGENQTSQDYTRLTYYDNVELSTMWKIYSINEVKAGENTTLPNAITDDGLTFTGFVPFSYALNSSMKLTTDDNTTDLGARAYYGTNARFNTDLVNGVTDGRLRVTLKKVATVNGAQYLQGGVGYAIMLTGTNYFNANTSIKSTGVQITSTNDYKDCYVKDKSVTKGCTNIPITEDNWKSYFVLKYVDPNTQIGTWADKAVYATGFGFYLEEPGNNITNTQVYIPTEAFNAIDFKASYIPNTTPGTPYSESVKAELIQQILDSGMGWEIEFQDENGNTTGIADVTGDGKVKMREVYDLNGRKLTEPQHGVNIINGKKVLIK